MHANQLRMEENLNQQLNKQSRLTTFLLQSNLAPSRMIPSIQSGGPSQLSLASKDKDPYYKLSDSIVRVGTFLPRRRLASCTTSCACSCHNLHNFKSHPILSRFLGRLFVGYSGYPSGMVPQCTVVSCAARLSYTAQVYYFFPTWLCSKLLSISLMSSPLGEPTICLSVRRIISPTAEIFHFASVGDSDSIQSLFVAGKGSPMDIRGDNGNTPLDVSVFHFTIVFLAST